MGGEIWLVSAEGIGTTVYFTLDCEEIPATNVKRNDLKPVEKNPIYDHKVKILLVDDVQVNRIIIQEYLKGTNHIIIEAEDGREAVKKVKQEEFDIILMDMQMPIMDGYTATKEIRAWEKQTDHDHIPIIATTGYATKDEQEKSVDAGCDQHLSKPILKKNLLEVLTEIENA